MPAEVVANATETVADLTPPSPVLPSPAHSSVTPTSPLPNPQTPSSPAVPTPPTAATETNATDLDDMTTDAQIVRQFLCDFWRLLDERTERIQELIDRGDLDAAGVALLSLETSSQMADAIDLVHATRAVRYAVESRADDVARCLQLLLTTAERTKAERTSR